MYKSTLFYEVCQKYEVWRSSNSPNTKAHQHKYISLVSVQFLKTSAVTETTGGEPWGTDKRVRASRCDRLSQTRVTAYSASCCKTCNYCTTYSCVVTYNTCLLLHHLLSAASFSRSTLKYSTCIQQII